MNKLNIVQITYIIIIFLLVLSMGAISGYITRISNTKDENNLPVSIPNKELTDIKYLFSENYNLEEYRTKYKNKDIIARLEIPNTFNLLITQADNNKYYLNHNIKRKKTAKGNEYLDYRNNISDKQLNIYGHNSYVYNLPFKNIENYLDKEYFNNNKYLMLQTDTENKYYKIVAIKEVLDDYEHMELNSKNHKKHISKLLKDSINKRNIKYTEDTNILVLQTCVRRKDSFYLLIAFEIEENVYENNSSK